MSATVQEYPCVNCLSVYWHYHRECARQRVEADFDNLEFWSAADEVHPTWFRLA